MSFNTTELYNPIAQETSFDNDLTIYLRNKFKKTRAIQKLDANSYVNTWQYYVNTSKDKGVFETLKCYLKQFQFPVKEGVSKSEAYVNATLRGKEIPNKEFLSLKEPEALELSIYNSIAGKIPVLIVENQYDFKSIIRALSYKSEPVHIPNSMGAALIKGINNWHRINTLKEDFLVKNPFDNWAHEFKYNIIPKPHLYKDTLIVLSSKPYSGVKATEVGVSEAIWKEFSMKIRLAHECAHLFTLQHYGTMANNMHDELIADYIGICEAKGTFDKTWFLHFLGLENYPIYRKGGRLENYTKDLSASSFKKLQSIIVKAADTLEAFDNYLRTLKTKANYQKIIQCLCNLDVLALADKKGYDKLVLLYNE